MKKRIYSAVNLIVLACVAFILYYRFLRVADEMTGISAAYIPALICDVVLVNLIKMLRFYFVLAGNSRISVREYAKQYCKITPVSAILPLKLGELFRIYCFGYSLNSFFMAFLFVLIDRFFDTLALVTVLAATAFVTRLKYTWLMQLFLLFIFATIILYLSLPQVCRYWKKYLLFKPASKRTLKMLSGIGFFDSLCGTVSGILKGKGVIAYILSLVSWGFEIGGAYLLDFIGENSTGTKAVQEYLSAALGVGQSTILTHFTIMTVVLFLIIYIVMHSTRKGRNSA